MLHAVTYLAKLRKVEDWSSFPAIHNAVVDCETNCEYVVTSYKLNFAPNYFCNAIALHLQKIACYETTRK